MNRELFFQTASGISLAMILSGCAIPHKADPSLTLAAGGQVMSAAETAERYDINGDWWQVYQSPQLNALVNQALANNTDLRQAAINVNKALYQANILAPTWCPRLTARWVLPLRKTSKAAAAPIASAANSA